MRSVPVGAVGLVVVAGAMSFGCASTLGNTSGSERVVVAVDAPPVQSSTSEVQVTEQVAAPQSATEPPRRRLSQTVTLGQGAPEGYSPAPAPAQANGGGTNVTVNNSVTVVNSPPIFYGGYYGGYGGAGYGRGGGALGGGRDSGRSAGTQAWAPNGWEGAQRTAAPGRTPNVGGNFAPPPNNGPPTMK